MKRISFLSLLVAISLLSFNGCEKKYSPKENGYENGYQYIELGLSVKWATFNVGATKPEEYGGYYAWGETVTKSNYSMSNYKWFDHGLTKYCNDRSYGKDGFTDNKTTLDPEDDVAHVKWGGSWRIPTKEEWEELQNKCTWSWTKINHVEGYLVTSKKYGYTDRSIFLPYAGYQRSEAGLSSVGDDGLYWSSSLNTFDPYDAWYPVNNISGIGRDDGLSVRPVCP